ncbi:MAG: hypothetical protein V4709_09040 [Pseudomonadota bacterium]
MHSFKLRTAVLAFSAVAILSACDDNNSSVRGPVTTPTPPPPTSVLTGRAALGALNGASCNAFLSNGTTPVPGAPTVTSGADGGFSFGTLNSSFFPIVVTCTGGNFFDEATGASVANSAPVSAVVPQARTSQSNTAAPTFCVTPLTNMAAASFLAQPPELRSNNLAASANAEIARALFPGGDILTPPTPVDSTNESLPSNSVADQYAAILASLSFAANNAAGATKAEKSANFLRALAMDAADGTINGQAGNQPIAGAGYTSFTSLESSIEAGTDSYEAANPAASGATNSVEAQEGTRGDSSVTPSPSGSSS